MVSMPISSWNFSHTGFIASIQALRWAGVSWRTVPPASITSFLAFSFTAVDSLFRASVTSAMILESWSRTSAGRLSHHSVEVTTR